MNGIIYCRVSSKEQTEGTSLESQELACQEYARSKHITILKVFVERGESAKFADRTQLVELLDFCRQNKGRVQVLIVWKIDRFARNVGDHFSIKAALLKYGVRILSVTEPIDTNPEGKLMETILAGFAQFDNDIRAIRCVQGMRRKLQEGLFPWKPPLGYKSANSEGEKKVEPDQPDQPLFDLLQKAWREFATGAYTKAEIRRLMESWGINTRARTPITAQGIDNLFANKYYAGIMVNPWSGEEHEGRHVPMVTREEFARVQIIIAKRSNSTNHQKLRPEFPLRGLVRCGRCQRYLTGSFSRGRSQRYAYYHCRWQNCIAHGKSIPVRQIHEEFFALLDAISPKPELLESLGAQILAKAHEQSALERQKRARMEAVWERLKREMEQLISMRAQELINDQEFHAHKTSLTKKLAAIEATAWIEEPPAEQIRGHLTKIMQPLTQLRNTWHQLPMHFRHRFQRLVLPVGFVNGKVGTAELGLLFKTTQGFQKPKSTGVDPGCKSWNQIYAEIIEFAGLLREMEELKQAA